jgi:hypothetical protein
MHLLDQILGVGQFPVVQVRVSLRGSDAAFRMPRESGWNARISTSRGMDNAHQVAIATASMTSVERLQR